MCIQKEKYNDDGVGDDNKKKAKETKAAKEVDKYREQQQHNFEINFDKYVTR